MSGWFLAQFVSTSFVAVHFVLCGFVCFWVFLYDFTACRAGWWRCSRSWELVVSAGGILWKCAVSWTAISFMERKWLSDSSLHKQNLFLLFSFIFFAAGSYFVHMNRFQLALTLGCVGGQTDGRGLFVRVGMWEVFMCKRQTCSLMAVDVFGFFSPPACKTHSEWTTSFFFLEFDFIAAFANMFVSGTVNWTDHELLNH